ncbi:MAG: hypothetical protein K6E47_15945 [Lachnospiraceae bacterium]|nr:hypothetical protein [Lachnospiraceae bacterium]
MKKVITKLILVLVICASFVSLANTDALQAKSSSTDSNAAQSALKKKLKKLFKSYSKTKKNEWNDYSQFDFDGKMTKEEFNKNYNFYYAYKDINGDGIDELLVLEEHLHYGGNIRGNLSIYSYLKGKVKCLTKNGDGTKIYIAGPKGFETQLIFADDCKYIYAEYSVDAYEGHLFKLSGKKYKEVANYFDGEGVWYSIYDKSTKKEKDVSEEEFIKFIEKALKNTCTVDWIEY